MDSLKKMQAINSIAENDDIYQVWFKSHQELVKAFEEYADSQPEDIRQLLWGYAGSGMMMLQRKLLLACVHMDFPK